MKPSSPHSAIRHVRPLMGGPASFVLIGDPPGLMAEVIDYAFRLEQLWSRFLETSDISRLNAAEGSPVEVDALTIRLIDSMLDGSALTEGDFDATLLPDVIAAGYRHSVINSMLTSTVPRSAVSPGRLDLAVIERSERIVTLPGGTTLDPGGIGKGFAADLICTYALECGAVGALAELSGDIVVAGQAPDCVAWRLGVENPFNTASLSSEVRLIEGALVTSSQRKRRFANAAEPGHDSTHHLIDQRSHRSAVTAVQTVSVIASSGARAEVLTKPGFVRTAETYLAWLPTVGAAGLIIDDSGLISTSANWEHYR